MAWRCWVCPHRRRCNGKTRTEKTGPPQRRQRHTLREQLRQRDAVEQFHRDVVDAVSVEGGAAVVKDRDRVRAFEFRRRRCFQKEAALELVFALGLHTHHQLERDAALEAFLMCLVDDAHTPPPENREEGVLAVENPPDERIVVGGPTHIKNRGSACHVDSVGRSMFTRQVADGPGAPVAHIVRNVWNLRV